VAPRDFRTRLSRRAARAGVFIPEDLADRLVAYYELLVRWNRKINLTSLDNPDEAIDRLLL
jgi:16S rRNA G527 N7-methylase RsmG